MIHHDRIQGVVYVLDGNEDQPRDEQGRWTEGSQGFADRVHQTARSFATTKIHEGQGEFGQGKVFIDHLRERSMADPYMKEHGIDTPEKFNKALLAARAAGRVTLSRLDLVQAFKRTQVEASELRHGNSEVHVLHVRPKGK